MKYTCYLLFCVIVLTVSSCQDDDDDFGLPPAYVAEDEIVLTGFSRTEGSQIFRVDVERGASVSFPNPKVSMALDLPFGVFQAFDFRRMQSINLNNQTLSMIEITPVTEEDGTSAEVPLRVNGELINDFGLKKILLRESADEALLFYRGGNVIYRLDLTDNSLALFTDSLEVGDVNASHFLLSPAEDKLYHFDSRDTYSGQMQVFDLNTMTLERSVAITPVFGMTAHPVSGRIFGVTAPLNGSGFRLAEFVPSAINPVRIISTEDLPIDNLRPTLQAIHTGTNTLLLLTGNNSLEAPTNILLRINLENGTLDGQTEFLAGQIVTGIFAE